MIEFALSLAVFLAAHVAPAALGLRERMISAVGRRSYIIGYSLASIALLVWVISAAQRAPYVELWPPAPWRHAAPILTMPIALAMIGAGSVRRNPLSLAFREGAGPPRLGGILSITRHPLLWGLLLWSMSHVLANGDVVGVVLFGGLGLFSLQAMSAFDRRARRTLGETAWRQAAAQAPLVPFAGLARGRLPARIGAAEALGAAAGLACYGWLMMGGHAWLFGTAPSWL
jgi:uncharacterized membrane protein